jgi:transcriptional regulator GlxA family with amidase domain
MTDVHVPEIGILLRDRALLGTVHGFADLFRFADGFAAERAGKAGPMLRVCFFKEAPEGIVRIEEAEADTTGARVEPAIIIVPPRESIPLSMEQHAVASDWLRARHASGATLAALCGGVFLLAQAGLLDGRDATTHWACADDLANQHRPIHVDADQMVIDDGDVITAAGMTAWTDLGLILVERILGFETMMDTARFMMIDPPRRQQRFYRKFTPLLTHGDHAVLLAQRQLSERGPCGVSVVDMARWAGLEVRTLVRRFHKATGLRPTEYCQRLRIERARALLESTDEPIGNIANDVGYSDPASFRKVFMKIMGLSPRQYRKRFGPLSQAMISATH